MDSVHYSSKTDQWETPQNLYDDLDKEFCFSLDVACDSTNQKCVSGLRIDLGVDGLAAQWGGVCWMNPPYGRQIGKWVEKAWREAQAGATVVCLLPARTDTKWFSVFWDHYLHRPRHASDEVRFLRGRLRFGGAKHCAPFPSVVVVMRP